MLASLFSSLLSAIAAFAPTIAAALGHKPVEEPSTPAPPGWAGIEGEEERAAAARAEAPTATGAPHQ